MEVEEDTLKPQNEYEQAVLSENIWSDAGLITQQREALMQIPISRPAEYMAPKEEKSSRSETRRKFTVHPPLECTVEDNNLPLIIDERSQ